MMQVKPEDWSKVQEACKKSLKFLCQQVLWRGAKESAWAPVHDEIAAHLENPGGRKLILVARGHLKSSVVTKAWTIQQMLRNPDIRILITNDTWNNARKYLRTIQKYLSPGCVLPQVFGDFQSEHWNQDECTVRQRKAILDAPTWATTGIEKEQTGQHYDLIIADDIVARENVGTPEQREKVKLYYKDLLDLLEPDGRLIVVGTRWHQDDLYGDLIENGQFDVFLRTAYKDDKKTEVQFPQKFTLEGLENLRKEKGAYEFACTPGETPILMSDWKTKPIEHVKVGDEIIGFTSGFGTGERSRLVKARVKRTFSKQDHVLRLIMKSGRTVLCTKDHKWYTGRQDESHPAYAPAKTGKKLQFVCPVEEKPLSTQEMVDWSYLAGLFDGEGSTKSGGCLTLSQCQSVNPAVHANITKTLEKLQIGYGTHVRDAGYSGRNHSPGNTSFWMRDSFNVGLNLIRTTNCAKAGQIADFLFKHGKRWAREEDEIVDIKYERPDTVYALETETGNYIAWGYASSNSQYLNNPIDEAAADFKASWVKFYDGAKRPPLSLYMTVDPAISLARDADYTAMIVAGMSPDRQIYVVDRVHKKMVPSDLVSTVFDLVEKWKLTRIGLETIAFQLTLKYEIEREMRKRGKFFSIDEMGRRDNQQSKEARIRRLQPYFEQGLVYLRPDMKDVVDELIAFPRGKHDDLIDALSRQLDYLVPASAHVQSNELKPGTVGWMLKQLDSRKSGEMYERYLEDLKRVA